MTPQTPTPEAAKADPDRELWALLALRHTPGVGPRTIKKILTGFPSAFQAVKAAASWPARRLASEAIAQAFASRAWEEEARREHAQVAQLGLAYLACTLPGYPDRLRELPDPPALLYMIGDATLLAGPCVAVVGSRDATAAGLAAARSIADGLSRAGVCVVSGLALGIDRAAHLGGLTGPGSSIAVLGTGVDVPYPPRNADLYDTLGRDGLVLSEFAPGTPPLPPHFPVRNRIIAGLSLAVVVVEAPQRSGSLITARLAMEQGAEVFAVPGPFEAASHRGCHALINQGARLFESVDTALAELAPALEGFAARPSRPDQTAAAPRRMRPSKTGEPDEPGDRAGRGRSSPGRRSRAGGRRVHEPEKAGQRPPRRQPPDLNPTEAAVWGAIPVEGQVHLDALGRELGLGSPVVSRTLIGLEVRGLVRKLPGMYYTRS